MKFPGDPTSATAAQRIMKSSYMFRDQVGLISNWFKGWNACEQTVMVYSLLRKMPLIHAKFLLQVLNSTVQAAESNDLVQLEADANDPGLSFIIIHIIYGSLF